MTAIDEANRGLKTGFETREERLSSAPTVFAYYFTTRFIALLYDLFIVFTFLSKKRVLPALKVGVFLRRIHFPGRAVV